MKQRYVESSMLVPAEPVGSELWLPNGRRIKAYDPNAERITVQSTGEQVYFVRVH